MRTYIIAEAGVNHNGSFELACELAKKAKECGADCVKFQTFVANNLVSKTAKLAEYQSKNIKANTQLEMLKKLELTHEEFIKLKKYCDEIKIDFVSSAFDLESISFLDKIGVPFWKIPSGEVTNYPYLVKIAKTRGPVVMSTGMCCKQEIGDALRVLRENGSTKIALLQCNTEYPTPFNDVNLLAMEDMRNTFNVNVGYSDHTVGIEIPVAAVALGATIIEKHFTLDKKMEGPDHKASLEPKEFASMVAAIKHVEQSLGNAIKDVTYSEKKNIAIVRKSIVASKTIKKGEILTEENLTVKRPGNGISPMLWNEVLGKTATKDYYEDDIIEL